MKLDHIPQRNNYLCASYNNVFKKEEIAESLRIFLSYGHDDKAFIACKIKEELESMGYKVWYDLERLRCGADWVEYIQQGLEWVAEAGSKARFILLMTPYSVSRPSGFCLNELTRAMEKEISIFPVMIESCEPPLSICRLQYLDMRQTYCGKEITLKFEEKIRELAQSLADNKSDFSGTLAKLRTILDPIPFEATVINHTKHFVGREWIKTKIDNWLNDRNSDKIFWITGDPGDGKSALASILTYEPYCKAFFLCKAPSTIGRGIYEPGDPRWCVRTIAYHLSAMLPYYRDLLNQFNLEYIIKEDSAESIFERLIVEGLSGIHFWDGQRAVVLIDGLDEVTRDGRNELSEFIVRNIYKTPNWLKFIITSRYEEPLISDLQRYNPCKIEDEKVLNEKDHRQFIEKEFTQFAESGILDTYVVETLMKKSEENFLYLEQVRNELEIGHLSLKEIDHFPKGLGEFYKCFFNRKFTDIQRFRDYYNILAIVFAVSTPLTLEEAESLFCWEASDIQKFENFFGAFIKYDNEYITLFHQSLKEWLTDQHKAGYFWIRLKDGHKLLAEKGYAAYKSKPVALTLGELKCIQELPIHLLFIKEFDKVFEFLSDPVVFVTYFSDNIFGYIDYWSSLCRQDAKERWRLTDCSRLISQKLDDCGLLKDENPHAWKACFSIGRLFFELKEYESASRMFQKSILLSPKSCGAVMRARLYNFLGESFYRINKIDDAEFNYRQALDIRKQLYKNQPHPDLAESINNYGHAFFHKGMYEKALEHYKEALEMYRILPDGPHYGEADSLNNIAMCFENIGNEYEAELTYKQCADVLDSLNYFNCWIPICRNNYGNFLLRRGRLEESLHQYQLSYELLMSIYGPAAQMAYNSYPYYESQMLLGRILRISGKWEKAEKIYREVIENGEKLWESIKQKPSSDDSRIFDIAVAYNEIAFYLYVPGQIWIEAEKYYRRAIELMETQKNEVEYANMRLNLCTVLYKSGKPIDEDEVKRFRDILKKAKDPRAEKGDKILKNEGKAKL